MKGKKRGSIRLTASQVAWLEIIAPDNPHVKYENLRSAACPSEKDILFDNGNFRRFVTGKISCRRELAEEVFKAYGTSWEQVEVVKDLPCLLDAIGGSGAASETAVKFFEKCGGLLWRGVVGEHGERERECVGLGIEPVLLDLVTCILEYRKNLTNQEKFLIFGQLLDYLNETRQYNLWPEWMMALSRQSNRDVFKRIRAKSGGSGFFPGVKKDPDGTLCYDLEAIGGLSKEDLDDCAFFVRRVNMSINEIRSDNFRKQQEEFEAIYGKLSPDERKHISSALHKLRARGKLFARNYFAWARENVKPYMEAVRQTGNQHRWYFLLCATRLMYDWARWHYYSTVDEDKRSACDMYRDIRDLADECVRDDNASPIVKCRFRYMAATACRYMAECSSEGIWRGDEDASDYVSAAVEYAREAVSKFGESCKTKTDNAETGALNYRFKRNCARILTFAARWWLLHPDERGNQPHMEGEDEDYPMTYGMSLLREAGENCAESIFLPVGPGDHQGNGPVVLYGKRQLEYEFHLRVCIEMLAFQFSVDAQLALPEDVPSCAMSAFCKIILIYDYLFKNVKPDGSRGKRLTVLAQSTVNAARQWLGEYKARCLADGEEVDEEWFDATRLDETLQGVPPSLAETRFETVCSIIYSTSARERATDSALWRKLKHIEAEVAHGKNTSQDTVGFVENVWRPASGALKADLDESCFRISRETARFDEENASAGKRRANWKGYPPFVYRFNLMAAPGNNSRHVDCIMRRHGMEWDRVKKEMEALK